MCILLVKKLYRKHAVLRACEYCFRSFRKSMQKCGKILRGRKDTLAPVVSTLRGEHPRRLRRSDASEIYTTRYEMLF